MTTGSTVVRVGLQVSAIRKATGVATRTVTSAPATTGSVVAGLSTGTDFATGSTVKHIGIKVSLAAIGHVAITVAKASIAGNQAGAIATRGSAIGGGTDVAAGTAIVGIAADIGTGAVAVHQPTRAAQSTGAVA